MSERYCPQADIVEWSQAVGITREELHTQIAKKTEEDLEVLEAWEAGDDEALAAELIDVAIVSLGMLGLLGVDFYQAAQDKMNTTWQKYNPDTIDSYRALGYSREEAFAQMKADWQLTHPNPSYTSNGEQPEALQLPLNI